MNDTLFWLLHTNKSSHSKKKKNLTEQEKTKPRKQNNTNKSNQIRKGQPPHTSDHAKNTHKM